MSMGPAKINLLPWREELKETKKKEFISILFGFVALTACILGFFHFYFSTKIHRQEARNTYLETETGLLDQRIQEIKELKTKKDELLSRMEIILRLQQDRFVLVKVFDDLPRILLPGVYLVKIALKNGILTIDGHSSSNLDVATFMRNVEHSKQFEDALLGEIKTTETEGLEDNTFSIQMELPSLKPVEPLAKSGKPVEGKH